MLYIIINEWKIFLRDRVFIYSTAFFVFSLVITVFWGRFKIETAALPGRCSETCSQTMGKFRCNQSS